MTPAYFFAPAASAESAPAKSPPTTARQLTAQREAVAQPVAQKKRPSRWGPPQQSPSRKIKMPAWVQQQQHRQANTHADTNGSTNGDGTTHNHDGSCDRVLSPSGGGS